MARGTSQSIIQRFLVEIDPAFAAEQYVRFRDRYVVTPLGLGPTTREYPEGMDGPADVDSGPLPLGVSLSATVVTLGAAQVHGDSSLAEGIASYGELLGLPVSTPWTKRYAFGLIPIGDAFVAWSKTARPWVAASPATAPLPPPAHLSSWWRVPCCRSCCSSAPRRGCPRCCAGNDGGRGASRQRLAKIGSQRPGE